MLLHRTDDSGDLVMITVQQPGLPLQASITDGHTHTHAASGLRTTAQQAMLRLQGVTLTRQYMEGLVRHTLDACIMYPCPPMTLAAMATNPF